MFGVRIAKKIEAVVETEWEEEDKTITIISDGTFCLLSSTTMEKMDEANGTQEKAKKESQLVGRTRFPT